MTCQHLKNGQKRGVTEERWEEMAQEAEGRSLGYEGSWSSKTKNRNYSLDFCSGKSQVSSVGTLPHS